MPNGCSYSDPFIYPNPENISTKKVLSEKDILAKKLPFKKQWLKITLTELLTPFQNKTPELTRVCFIIYKWD